MLWSGFFVLSVWESGWRSPSLFSSRRFVEVRPWVWGHQRIPEVEVSAESSDKSHLKKMSHLIREGWRFYCWDQFLQTSRHEVSTTAHVQASSLRQVNWSAIRSLSDSSGACRTVSYGRGWWYRHSGLVSCQGWSALQLLVCLVSG